MNTIAVIQARMGSTRLPGKVMRPLCGHPVLEWVVRAVNAAFAAEAQWVSDHTKDAEYIAHKKAGYRDEIRDQFVALDRKYRLYPVNDKEFVEGLQKAADWLVARKVLPEPVTVSDHLAKL